MTVTGLFLLAVQGPGTMHGMQMGWETTVSTACMGARGKVTLCPPAVTIIVLCMGENMTGQASATDNAASGRLSQTVILN